MIGDSLIDLMVVLIAAKVGSEFAERLGVPAVLGEITAGILIGPSALALLHHGDFLKVVGEVGVILLLVEVGMEMDLRELAKVGRASLGVAIAGMVVPFVAGLVALRALGESTDTAVFLGAALTATSVGITARAFGDLRALGSTEARVVIGAAVADDVLGLVVLTVVAGVVQGDDLGANDVLRILGVAVGFLVVATVAGLAGAPRVFGGIQRWASSPGTMVALAMAFTLAVAELASLAELAPIVGAFVAGLALGRTDQAERIRRDLAPVGHLFVPVFFVLIGTEARLDALGDPKVLGVAAVLGVLAVVGKVAAGWAGIGTPFDRLLVGIGMVPRGEVGLIFATIGKSSGVLDADLYAALLLVVLVTTIVTPPLLRWRHGRLVPAVAPSATAEASRPIGGWLTIDDDTIRLKARPPSSAAVELALDTARLAVEAEPGDELLSWFEQVRGQTTTWSPAATDALMALLPRADARSWRLLDATGVLDVALPELGDALSSQRRDLGRLDVARLHDWPTVSELRVLGDDDGHDRTARQQLSLLGSDQPVYLGALLSDVADAIGAPGAQRLLDRLELDPERAHLATAAWRDAVTLRSMVTHRTVLDPADVVAVAVHLGSVDALRAAYLVSVASGPLADWQRERLDELTTEVERQLEIDPEDDLDLLERRRRTVGELVGSGPLLPRLRSAPRSVLLDDDVARVTRVLRLASEGLPPPGLVRVEVAPSEGDGAGCYEVIVMGRDVSGFFARVAGVLADVGLDVHAANAAAWPDGLAVDVFDVSSSQAPDPRQLADSIRAALRGRVRPRRLDGIELSFDNASHPWHTICNASGTDQPGALAGITAAIAAAGGRIHAARVETGGGVVADQFALNDATEHKLSDAMIDAIRRALEGSS